MNKSLKSVLSDEQLLADGIRDEKYSTTLKAIGITETEADDLDNKASELRKANAEQEKLKADLKVATKKATDLQDELYRQMMDDKKRIKLVIPQEEWVAFGITDKRWGFIGLCRVFAVMGGESAEIGEDVFKKDEVFAEKKKKSRDNSLLFGYLWGKRNDLDIYFASN